MRHTIAQVTVAGLLVAGCSVRSGPAGQVTLVELVEDQESFDGREVVTRGVVRTFDEPRHYWIEDVDQNRVELTPMEVVDDHLGDEVEVRGRFTFRDDEGRRIAVDQLEVLTDGDDAAA